jgi:hypothetical protein
MVSRWSNPSAVRSCITAAQQALRPDFKPPEDRAREHLRHAADLWREAGNRDAEKRTRRLLARLNKETER